MSNEQYPFQEWARGLIRRRQVAKRKFVRPGELSCKQMVAAVRNRDGENTPCCWCRLPFGEGKMRSTLEHVIPLSEGGEHVLSNCALAHAKCNHERGAKNQRNKPITESLSATAP